MKRFNSIKIIRENQVLKFFDNRYEKKYSKICVGASR